MVVEITQKEINEYKKQPLYLVNTRTDVIEPGLVCSQIDYSLSNQNLIKFKVINTFSRPLKNIDIAALEFISDDFIESISPKNTITSLYNIDLINIILEVPVCEKAIKICNKLYNNNQS